VQLGGADSRDKPVYPELGRWAGELHAAFDQAGNLYASDTDHWRGSPDDEREEFSRIAAFDPSGKPLWRRDLTAPRATDEPEYCVTHIWGTGDAAVFFGDTRICSHDSRGRLLWAIARPADFASVAEVPKLGLSIASDPRLRHGPRVVTVHGHGWEFKVCALDSEQRVYFCVPFHLVCLEPDYRLRWACELPAEHLYGPIIGPGGTVLVRSFRTLYSVE
jgi:hypothetical protein